MLREPCENLSESGYVLNLGRVQVGRMRIWEVRKLIFVK